MLPSTSSRETLLACHPFPPWNLHFFTMESTLSSPCSRTDLALFCQGATLVRLDSFHPHDPVLWTDSSVPFFLAKTAPAYLPTALSVALRPLFPSQQAQYVQVFLLKPTPFGKPFAGLGNTKKFAISVLFSSHLTFVLSFPLYPLLHLSSYIKLCGISGRNCLLFPPVPSGYNGSPVTRFSGKQRG